MREIVTLQLGQASNYAATHFWNAQESYFTYSSEDKSPIDHNIHWRAGVGSDGSETFLPRTVIYDLKGGFGSLRKINALYEPESEATPDALWSGPSTIHKQQPIEPSAYQQSLDTGTNPPRLTTSTVRYWSDFSRSFFHPRSLIQLYDFELNSTTMPFERFSMGHELFNTLDKEHELIDRDWRPFAEECDLMQGIQVFTSIDDAWGGFASSYIESLRDEYPKSCIWIWGLQGSVFGISRAKRQLRLVNTAHSIDQLCDRASTLVPLALQEGDLSPSLAIDTHSMWHTSAVMAAAFETATLPSRLTKDSGNQVASLDYLAECLNPAGNQPLSTMQTSIASTTDPLNDNRIDIDFFQLGRDRSLKKDRHVKIFGQVISSRCLKPLGDDEDLSDRYDRLVIGKSVLRKYETALKFPLLDSYPSIFPQSTDQVDIGILTDLSTNTLIAPRIKSLRSEVTRLVRLDEREGLGNGLAELAEAYREDWSSGSDDDNDDS